MSHPAGSEHEAFRTVYDFRSHTRPARAFLVPPPVPFTVLTDHQARLRTALGLLQSAAGTTRLRGKGRDELKNDAHKTNDLLYRLAEAFPNEKKWQTADKADTERSAEGKIGFLTTYQAEFIKSAASLLEKTAALRQTAQERNLISYQLASKVSYALQWPCL